MSTHNIGFYEDLTKIILELSSNVIKYTPYFLSCVQQCIDGSALLHGARNPRQYETVFVVSRKIDPVASCQSSLSCSVVY